MLNHSSFHLRCRTKIEALAIATIIPIPIQKEKQEIVLRTTEKAQDDIIRDRYLSF